jgi:hypothetical protein
MTMAGGGLGGTLCFVSGWKVTAYLLKDCRGTVLDDAIVAIESANPSLEGVLRQNYGRPLTSSGSVASSV